MGQDEDVTPRLAQYLASLPQGLASHPAAVTKADFSLILRRYLAPCSDKVGVPEPVRALLTTPWRAGDWIPTCHYVALCALARDQVWTTEEAYHLGMMAVATEMYQGPIHRALFIMFGPSLVAMGAARRWGTLHKGTELVVKRQLKESVELETTFPPRLFTEESVRSLGAAFCAIAVASHGKDTSFQLLDLGETSARMLIGWHYWSKAETP